MTDRYTRWPDTERIASRIESAGKDGGTEGGYGRSGNGDAGAAEGYWGRREEGPHRGRGPRGYRRSDERVWDDVGQRLMDDPWLDATDIDVRVEEGEVTLDGTVDSRAAKRRAEDIADSVSGARHVQNNLRVRQ